MLILGIYLILIYYIFMLYNKIGNILVYGIRWYIKGIFSLYYLDFTPLYKEMQSFFIRSL